MLRKRNRAQSTLEYAVVIAVVVGALLAIQIYMKRGVQGKLRESTDQIGEQFDAEKTHINRTTNREGTTVQKVKNGTTTSYSGGTDEAGQSLGVPESREDYGIETVGAW